MTNKDFVAITEALLKTIGRADEEFQAQIAMGIGVSVETLNEYLDKADVSGVKGAK